LQQSDSFLAQGQDEEASVTGHQRQQRPDHKTLLNQELLLESQRQAIVTQEARSQEQGQTIALVVPEEWLV